MDCLGFHYWSKRTKLVYPSFCLPTAERKNDLSKQIRVRKWKKIESIAFVLLHKTWKMFLEQISDDWFNSIIVFLCLSPFSDRRLDCSNRDWIRQTAPANNNSNSGTFSRRGYFKCRYHWASGSRDLRMFSDSVNGFHCINTSRAGETSRWVFLLSINGEEILVYLVSSSSRCVQLSLFDRINIISSCVLKAFQSASWLINLASSDENVASYLRETRLRQLVRSTQSGNSSMSDNDTIKVNL